MLVKGANGVKICSKHATHLAEFSNFAEVWSRFVREQGTSIIMSLYLYRDSYYDDKTNGPIFCSKRNNHIISLNKQTHDEYSEWWQFVPISRYKINK